MNKKSTNVTIAIVVSKFNEFISQRLLKGCLQELNRQGIKDKNIDLIWVPGSFELPVAALKLAKDKRIDAVICLGAVIRGETYHFEMISQSVAYGIQNVALMTGKPIIFGVLTTDTVEQANKRSQEKGENKGVDAAVAAIEMIKTLSQIEK